MGAPFVWYDVTATPGHADAAREFYATSLGWTIAPTRTPAPTTVGSRTATSPGPR